MAVGLRRYPLELAIAVTLATTVVLFVLGSGATARLQHIGGKGRWAALVILVALSLWAARSVLRLEALRLHHWFAAALLYLVFVSAFWTVDTRLTLERGATLLLLLVGATAFGAWVDEDAERVWWLLAGVAAAVTLVCLLGFVLAAVDRSAAVQPADPSTPWRLRGLGQNPNTVPLLVAVALPACLAFVTRRERTARIVGSVGALLALTTIALSGARGAWTAAAVAALVFAAGRSATWRRRAVRIAVTAALLVLTLAATKVAQPSSVAAPARANGGTATSPSPPTSAAGGATTPSAPHASAQGPPPSAAGSATTPSAPQLPPVLLPSYLGGCAQEDQLGRPLPGQTTPSLKRSLFGTSGRGVAWDRALHEAAERPFVGYGFGTEGRVFYNCFYTFLGALPENSYLGMLLQLGVVGLVALLTLVAGLALAAGRAARRLGTLGLTGFAVIAAGLVAAITQSYLYSVGNVATVSFWILAFAAAALARHSGDRDVART